MATLKLSQRKHTNGLTLSVALMCTICMGVVGCSPNQDAGGADYDVLPDESVDAWPIALSDAQGRILVYQPQPESLDGNQLKARAAVSLTPSTGPAKFGAAWFTARLTTDRDTRTATLDTIRVSIVRLLGVTTAEQQQLANAVASELTQMSVNYPLDQFMTTLETAQHKTLGTKEIGIAPPKIIFSNRPAMLITVAGPPQIKPVSGRSGISRVINTPFVLLQTTADHRLYLKEGAHWATAAELEGPWQQNAKVPGDVNAVGQAITSPAPRAATEPAAVPTTANAADLATPPTNVDVIVSTVPAELIVTQGDPKFTPIAGGQLLYASNTESNLFLDSVSNQYLVLLSGRWYTATSLQGPWQYETADKLPPAFADIQCP
jgi:hypothetical protein